MDDNTSPNAEGLDLKEIRQIVDLMSKNDLSFFHLEHGSFKIKLRRGADIEAAKAILAAIPMQSAPAAVYSAPPAAPLAGPAAAAPAPAAAPAAAAAPETPIGPTINSPMVGTFYRSPTPTDKSFVNVGDHVDENTVVCIIEAMKVMNEIKAETSGTIARILVENSKPVQYGQPLFELK